MCGGGDRHSVVYVRDRASGEISANFFRGGLKIDHYIIIAHNTLKSEPFGRVLFVCKVSEGGRDRVTAAHRHKIQGVPAKMKPLTFLLVTFEGIGKIQ